MSEPNNYGVPQWSHAGPPPPRKSGAGLVILSCIGLLVGLGVVIAIFSGSGDDDSAPAEKSTYLDTPADNRDWAILACQDAIESQLKDPGSASYRGESAVRQTGTQTYDVAGEVNARNSFGGMVGFKGYTCTASLDQARTTMNAQAVVAD